MLFYFEDRWAYMMGMVAPAIWLVLTTAWNGAPSIGRQALNAFQPGSPFFATDFLTTAAYVLSVVLIVSCANRWRREFGGLNKGWSTFLVSFVNRCRLLCGGGCSGFCVSRREDPPEKE